MALTNDEYYHVGSDKEVIAKSEGKTLKVNISNPLAMQDYSLIINVFEKEASNWVEEDYALAYHYKDVYSTRNFSERVREQMDYYPGMHQTSSVPTTDPFYTNAKEQSNERLNFWDNAMDNPDAFMNGLRSREQDFDYTKIFGTDSSAKTKAENIGKVLTDCIPCFGRLLDADALIPDGDILEVHMLNIKARTDSIDKLKKFLKDPGMNMDICEILNLLSSLCPPDLLAMLALLTQFLAKLNLDIKFNLDFIMNLVGAILSPFLNALSQWLDKWIQMILGPMICVVDHVNEVIITAQQAKIPFSEGSIDISADLGVAAPAHKNASLKTGDGITPTRGAWSNAEFEAFNTPDSQKYNPQRPDWPDAERELASEEMAEEWNPSMSQVEREATNAKWANLKEKERVKREKIPPPLKSSNPRDGTRWSKDSIPNSEKYETGYSKGDEYYPPEKQDKVKDSEKYWDASPLVNSIVQIRNILQGAIQYVNDWFTYITQMIYDLLGTDIGWMEKKTGSTVQKSRIIQLIRIIKSILSAMSQNGLKCGSNSNFDQDQLKFILEEGLNKYSSTQFKVLDNGDIEVIPAGANTLPDAEDLSEQVAADIAARDAKAGVGAGAKTTTNDMGVTVGPDIGVVDNKVKTEEVKQKSIKSGIIVKNCLKDLTTEELNNAKQWIAEYERRYNG